MQMMAVRARLVQGKDTVGSRKQSSSSEEFSHDAADWPNIHWNTEKQTNMRSTLACRSRGSTSKRPSNESTRHVVVHPVQHDLRGTVPARGHVAGHLVVGVPRQTKVQNLGAIKARKSLQNIHICELKVLKRDSDLLTFSSQSSFTARLPGFKSYTDKKHIKVNKASSTAHVRLRGHL